MSFCLDNLDCDLKINNDKSLFNKLYEYKTEIEEQLGELEWDSKEKNKSAKIRKIYEVDISEPNTHQKAVEKLITMGAELKAIAHKYL